MKMAPEPDARTVDVAGTAQATISITRRSRVVAATRARRGRFACTMLILVRKKW